VALNQALIIVEGEIAGLEGHGFVVQVLPEEMLSPEQASDTTKMAENFFFRPQGSSDRVVRGVTSSDEIGDG